MGLLGLGFRFSQDYGDLGYRVVGWWFRVRGQRVQVQGKKILNKNNNIINKTKISTIITKQ